ncbi:hypothetical protein AbraIFM66950_010743 [Aspergillus brasiliensis]|nr:hypothetical protein AbraIFM66950_010743 [Aspergillus brasiliensis]
MRVTRLTCLWFRLGLSFLLAPDISTSGNSTTGSGNSSATGDSGRTDKSGISHGAVADAVVGAVFVIAAVFFGLSRMRQKRILVPMKESDAKSHPAELAQGSHVPEMDDEVVTELPGMADGKALKSSVSHEVDLPVSEIPVRASTMRYELD